MLEMGHATLELFDEGYAEYIDDLEAGRRVSGPMRFALQVPDLLAAPCAPLRIERHLP
jgi:methylmalonyl-CoA/ethylmalonyl-CoA epimerase